jgi:putative membrane protein insertion efficiency factor
VKFLGKLVAWPLFGLVWLYRYAISPLLGANCRFQPSCSSYALEALQRYGGFKGGWLMLKRISRCHPWGGSGYDPVPINTGSDSVAEKDTDESD